MSESYERPAPKWNTSVGSLADATPAVLHHARIEARRWLGTAERIGQIIDLDASAQSHGALQRRRGVRTTSQLLALILMHGPGQLQVRQLVEHAQLFDIAHLSEAALIRRLANAQDWSEDIVEKLLIESLLNLSYDKQSECEAGANFSVLPYASWREQSRAARDFIYELTPWPTKMFNEAQAHWLVGIRWDFMASTVRRDLSEHARDHTAWGSLDRLRRAAHLAACLAPMTLA